MSDDEITATVGNNDVEIRAFDLEEEVAAAANAAFFIAEALEIRYGEDSQLAKMLRSAHEFAHDFLTNSGLEHLDTTGQIVDVMLLGMAAGWYARTLERSPNTKTEAKQFELAAETMADFWAEIVDHRAIDDIAEEDFDRTEHRYQA